MIKETIKNKIDSGELSIAEFGCDKGDKYCLVNTIFNMIPLGELSELKSMLFDSAFVSIMKDAQLTSSIEEFFACNLNISETSKQSFLHRNTLVYRLDKIQKITGFNLRNFQDAITFKVLMMLYNRFN